MLHLQYQMGSFAIEVDTAAWKRFLPSQTLALKNLMELLPTKTRSSHSKNPPQERENLLENSFS